MQHTFTGETIEFELIRKQRRTMGIYIDVYGRIEVRVPKDAPEAAVLQLLEQKWGWIRAKSREMQERTAGYREKTYASGETFLYLGVEYPIQICPDAIDSRDFVLLKDKTLQVHVGEAGDERVKQALKHFYYQQCKALVEARTQFYQYHFKCKPRSIRIADSKRSWGSCDGKLQLAFNWKLAMAPLEVVDYIVVHELCHMVHLNHDRSFWRLVGKILPDYEQRQAWLVTSGWKMVI